MQFLQKLSGKGESSPATKEVKESTSTEKKIQPQTYNLLILDASFKNWSQIFKGAKVNGKEVKVFETNWKDMNLTSYSTYGMKHETACFVDITAPGQPVVTMKPDFVLVRSLCKGALPDQDYVNKLYGLKYAGVPAINSLDAAYLFLERPWVFGELLSIKRRVGADKFPLIDQNYYPNHREMIIGPQFPAVVKVGHAHAGYGKMKIHDHHDFADFASIIAVNKNYVTAEPFLEGEYDLRIQKIGNHYRVFKRMAMGNNWKTNTGTSVMEEVEVSPLYKFWADEAGKMFGGLDIFAVDAIHTTDGKEFILEVNDSSIGLHPEREQEDMGFMRDMVLERMTALFKDT